MPNNPTSQEIFTKIHDANEKLKIFTSLVAAKGEVIAKLPEPQAEIFIARAQDLMRKKLILKLVKANVENLERGKIILTFFADNEKYFFYSDYSLAHGDVYLDIENSLFHLQRREDYRIKIPTSYKARIEVSSINEKPNKHNFTLLDLSGGGCRIQWDSTKLQIAVGDHLRGELVLPDRFPIAFKAQVQHMRTDPIEKTSVAAGLQFEGLSEQIKNRIVAVVMDLYREFFTGRLN